MNQEILRIQKMVAEGKVTAEESVELLASIRGPRAAAGGADAEQQLAPSRAVVRAFLRAAWVLAVLAAVAGFVLFGWSQREADKQARRSADLAGQLVSMTQARDETERLRRGAEDQITATRRDRDACEQNMKMISRALLAAEKDNHGQMPSSLDELYRKGHVDSVPHCPFGGGRPTVDYFYLPLDRASADPDRLVVCDIYPHASDPTSLCVMFADGRVATVTLDEFREKCGKKNEAFLKAVAEQRIKAQQVVTDTTK